MSICAQSLASINRKARYNQILGIFKECNISLTAHDVVMEMRRRDYIPTLDMNFARPRLTELEKEGYLVKDGTRWDPATNRNVTAYRLAAADENGQMRMF